MTTLLKAFAGTFVIGTLAACGSSTTPVVLSPLETELIARTAA